MAASNHDALAILFDRYQRLVLSVALKIVKDVGEAEEVMQGVFFELYRAACRFDSSRGTVRTWILQYARSRSINRRQQLSLRHHYSHCDFKFAGPESLANCFRLNEAELQRLVQQALKTLTDGQKAVLQKAYFDGLSLKEIAEQSGESFGSVRHHYYRGLAKLKQALSDEEDRSSWKVSKQGMIDAEA
jgi:RNA polymerase sigma-70 factor (ECF subfamily)